MQGFVLGICSSQLFIPPAPVGYIAGGSPYTSTVDTFRYDNDVRSTLAVGLSGARSSATGFASSTAGYVAGGNQNFTDVATVDRFAFADNSRSTLASGLSSSRGFTAGFSSSTAGYAAGGLGSSIVSTVDKFAFADDSRSTLGTGLASNRYGASGFASSTHGYAAGGLTGLSGTSADWVDSNIASKFAFADDSRTTLIWTLNGRGRTGSFQSASAGYVAGGVTNVNWSEVTKILFSDDSYSALASGLSSARERLAGFSSDVAGYAAGGFTSVAVDTVDKFDFSDDSRTTLGTGLSSARLSVAGFGSPP